MVILGRMGWWRRKKTRPDADDLQRQVQATRDRLAEVEAEIRRQAAEQEIEQLKRGPQADGT
jgi:hypothetical protein